MESQHYFSATPAGPDQRRALRVVLDGRLRELVTAGGIFSPDGVDKGTSILLAEVPPPEGQTLLDIGCGWGPLALTMALQEPKARVVAVDVNERALGLVRENASRLGLDNLSAAAPDAVAADLTFDTIWSNPPIRIGKEALHALLLTWLPRLAPGGTAWLVVQKNLGADSLQRWLVAEFDEGYEVDRAATAKSFRILRVTRRDTGL
ncbi:16S rRNA G1207 methylase RsmC [Arthrobacter pigmenti]|uniref:16S rRNA G1207 methylase RsmC n=1 Tax=Arthrobacter pigmenti TaxID=271432 RepID=A0A846RJX3_9MICC|nr:methyltransferase [Arthrobacter pigmenti]NJC21970.1 16S rRNA G1207 methylase RsmC [Arthrobacter pigmenti]